MDKFDERRANVLQLSERVKQLRNNSLLQELPKYESEITQMENELQELQFDHDAYQHIVRIATMEQINFKLKVEIRYQRRLIACSNTYGVEPLK